MVKRHGMLSLGDLRGHIDTGTIDTVLVAFTDMQGPCEVTIQGSDRGFEVTLQRSDPARATSAGEELR